MPSRKTWAYIGTGVLLAGLLAALFFASSHSQKQIDGDVPTVRVIPGPTPDLAVSAIQDPESIATIGEVDCSDPDHPKMTVKLVGQWDKEYVWLAINGSSNQDPQRSDFNIDLSSQKGPWTVVVYRTPSTGSLSRPEYSKVLQPCKE